MEYCNLPLEKRRTKAGKKNSKKKILRECRDGVNKQMRVNLAIVTLAEDESLSKYQCKRLAQSFEKPQEVKVSLKKT